MKKFGVLYLVLIFILAACAPQAQPTEQGLLPDDDYGSEPSPADWTPAQQAAITTLSQNLNLPPGQISLISTEAVEWPDGCLGIQRAGLMCTEAIVPGYRIILQANTVFYEVRTNEDGSQTAMVGEAEQTGSVEEMLVKQLAANLGLKETEISVTLSTETEFPDSCLGVSMQDIVCAQVVTPGKIVLLEAKGIEYEYHVSEDGTHIQPATLVLTWTRDGGIAGFCDRLTIFLSGEVYGNQCKSQPNGTMGTFAVLLTKTEREQLEAWLQEFGEVDLDASDPVGVSDRMAVTLQFYGNGNGKLTKADERALMSWAQDVFQKLYS